MPTYVTLINWTDQGVRTFTDTVDRYEAAQQRLQELGVTFREIFWTIGPYDIVSVVDAPDDESVTASMLAIAAQGNIRTTTLRAFNRDEMRGIIQRVG
jgi:uncharacterized protein with GYD domain